ncbi:MAG UNVERIFIED_CONTAM: alcohol dehydrogenase catalytic domain-containing protein [Planctomycetaceae bacterium]|jgi:alcohol dehydrogenase
MKAIRLEEPRRFQVIDIAEPAAPGPGQVLVRTHRMGVCGTDLSGYLGKFPFFRYPRIPGHELGVEVLEVGPGVTDVKPGDRCSVEPYMNCGSCYACRRGNGNCCTSLNVIGVMIDGGLCERFLIRADKLHSSAQLNYEQLALVETLAIGCHANERGNPGPGDHCAYHRGRTNRPGHARIYATHWRDHHRYGHGAVTAGFCSQHLRHQEHLCCSQTTRVHSSN